MTSLEWAAGRRKRNNRRLLGLMVALVLLPVGCGAWWFFSREDPARFVATLDSLPLPPTWEVVESQARRDLLFPTQARRSFLVDADPPDAADVLKGAMVAVGFEIYVRTAPRDWCDPHPLDSIMVACTTKVIEDCNENGPGGPIRCFIEAFRRMPSDPARLEHLYAGVTPRGSTVDFGPGASPRYLTDPNRALVGITADLSDPRHFWSSPTPPPGGGDPSVR